MAQLNELKEAIDQCKTAKLRQWRSILHWFVKKERSFYIKQQEGYTNHGGVVIVQAKTAFYLEWEELVNALGYDAEAGGWEIMGGPPQADIPS
jgi:hypothetical protein